MVFKLRKDQLARRDALAADLRSKANALNVAISAFNEQVEPLSQAVAEAQVNYNESMEAARILASQISEAARGDFEAKSERWQESDNGIQVRTWIEEWEMSLDDVDLDLPEPLEEIDPDEHADQLEAGPASPVEQEQMHRH
jgi:hypothetical protein